MDCKTARLLLDFARPLAGDLDEADSDALATHLADCSSCKTIDREERRVDEHLGRAMRAVAIPDGLRDRLVHRLAGERDSWYRGRLLWPGLPLVIGPIAASLLIWFGVAAWNRPVIPDIAAIQANADSLPDPTLEVQGWLTQHSASKPSQFNYGLLTHSGMAELQGKRVPLLVFRQGPETALVYVLDDRQFNLKSLENRQPGPSGRYTVDVLLNPAEPHVAYVVVYTGGQLDVFATQATPH